MMLTRVPWRLGLAALALAVPLLFLSCQEDESDRDRAHADRPADRYHHTGPHPRAHAAPGADCDRYPRADAGA